MASIQLVSKEFARLRAFLKAGNARLLGVADKYGAIILYHDMVGFLTKNDNIYDYVDLRAVGTDVITGDNKITTVEGTAHIMTKFDIEKNDYIRLNELSLKLGDDLYYHTKLTDQELDDGRVNLYFHQNLSNSNTLSVKRTKFDIKLEKKITG